MHQVSTALGVGQKGWIAIAALSGCDFLPRGAGGVGIEKAMQCVRAMLKHIGDEASLSEFMVAALEGGLPDELRAYASLSGCMTSIPAWSAGSRCRCYVICLSHRVCVCVCAAVRVGASDVDMDRLASCRMAALDAFSVVPRAAWVDLVVASRGLLDPALAGSIAITTPWFWPCLLYTSPSPRDRG